MALPLRYPQGGYELYPSDPRQNIAARHPGGSRAPPPGFPPLLDISINISINISAA
jgi:hypothetical protein